MDDGNTADVVHLDFAEVFDLGEKVVQWTRPHLTDRAYTGESGLCAVARDKHHRWDASQISGWATFFLLFILNVITVLTLFFTGRRHDGVSTFTKQPSLQSLEVVVKLEPQKV